VIIEIGAGKGALTESMLEREDASSKIVAIEVDPVLVHYLIQKFQPAIDAGRLEIIDGDVLKVDLALYTATPGIVGNLPYYITSPILEKVFALGGNWSSAVFLVQAEVADRITAVPGTRDFGYLSVLAQVHSHAEQLFGVPREAFRPPPKVESAVIRLTPRNPVEDFGIEDAGAFLRFAQTCFRHKRKTLRNNLLETFSAEQLTGLAEMKLRAEQLGVPELAALYKKLAT
jgi:16S rRNA (adenine1518-N6/adenine1519-N6)-dimethyltransferase